MTDSYILARTFREGHGFAADVLGLSRGRYRLVTSPGMLRGVRGAYVYLVPGWDRRPDRFGMIAALRWTKLTVVDGEVEEDPVEVEEDPVEVEATEQPPAPSPVSDIRRRRRRRCTSCGALILPEDASDHVCLPEAG